MTAYELIHALSSAAGAGRRAPAPFGLIEVSGPDATDFLHRLCSQDVTGLAVGRCAPAAFLGPKGKLVATATIARVADDRLFVEVARTLVPVLAELLDRYHFSERLAIRRHDELAAADVLGVALPGDVVDWTCRAEGAGLELCGRRRGVLWRRRHGPAAELAGWHADRPALDPALAACLRIVAGLVEAGVDTDPNTLGLEADLDDHVSTTKGCYVGQEIVARIHTYGHVNRRLALVVLQTADPVERGTPLCDADGDPVGRVMSAAAIPGRAESVALGFLPDALVADPEPLVLGGPGGAAAQVEAFAPA